MPFILEKVSAYTSPGTYSASGIKRKLLYSMFTSSLCSNLLKALSKLACPIYQNGHTKSDQIVIFIITYPHFLLFYYHLLDHRCRFQNHKPYLFDRQKKVAPLFDLLHLFAWIFYFRPSRAPTYYL